MTFRRSIWDFLRSPFAWRDFRQEGVWLYQVNEVTGARQAIRIVYGGFSTPKNSQWLAGGDWERQRPPPPPRTGSVLPSRPVSIPMPQCVAPRSRNEDWS